MNRAWQQMLRAILIGGCVVVPIFGAQHAPAATVTVELEKTTVTRHEPVLLRFTLSNSASKTTVFQLGYGQEKDNVKVKVTDPEGWVWAKPRLTPRRGVEWGVGIVAAAHTTNVGSVALSDWFTFNKLGDYVIEVAVTPSEDESPANLQIPETRLTLTVLPRDEPALASACASLVSRVENWESGGDNFTAADALVNIDDPVAVPYLARAMEVKSASWIMVEALARLNTPDAVKALVEASRSTDPELSAHAKATLIDLGREEKQR